MKTNRELELAWQFIENTDTSLFLTGKAGTGKTTFLKELKEKCSKRMVVLAPTGIAAINAGGVTIHSFFQLPFSPFIPEESFRTDNAKYKFQYRKEHIKIIRSLDLIVIDEISMVRADLMDAIDSVLRKFKDREKPFGGVQLLMIGDLQQLPPVVKEDEWEILRNYYNTMYFFSSHALKSTNYFIIELKEVYRQNDIAFLEILNKIRENRCDQQTLDLLNKRYIPDFKPDENEGYIRLTTHNSSAQQINSEELKKICSREYTYRAEIIGRFPAFAYPADEELILKKGAQIMFLKNGESDGERYYNGMLGKITDLGQDRIIVESNDTGIRFELEKGEWSNAKYVINEKTKEIVEEIEGVFRQYPVRLAWAITIHKSQGLTFEHAVIDAASAFAHGQTYVALSRCKTLEGLVLSSRLNAGAIITDRTVDNYIQKAREHSPNGDILNSLKKTYYLNLLNDLFSFSTIENSVRRTTRIIDEFLYKTYPELLKEFKNAEQAFNEKVVRISGIFRIQYTRILTNSLNYQTDSILEERIRKGTLYFAENTRPLLKLIENGNIDIDNKETEKKYTESISELGYNLVIKLSLLEYIHNSGFSINKYINKKAVLSISTNEDFKKKGKQTRTKKPSIISTDIRNTALYEKLSKWRREKANSMKVPAYTILQQKALIGIANNSPKNINELLKIAYVGKKTADKFGYEIIEIVRSVN